MTSVSELFYTRRYRLGRTTANLGVDYAPSRRNSHYKCNLRHHTNHKSHHRHNLDVSDPVAAASHHLSLQGGKSVQPSLGSSNSNQSNLRYNNYGAHRWDQILNQNCTLPGPVLLARERLLVRLRGVSLSSSESVPTAFCKIESEIETSLSGGRLWQEEWKNPAGLSEGDLKCLKMEEGFRCEGDECSICLEGLNEEDELICLPCNHCFHTSCLAPWLLTCGNCPYCRRSLTFT